MMTALMKAWGNEVKKSAKEFAINIVKDTTLMCIVKTFESYYVKAEKAIRKICRRNEWDEEDFVPTF